MKVTAVRQWTANFITYNATYIRIETDEGVVGESEVSMRRRTRTVSALVEELGEYLIGKDPTRIEQHSERMYRDAFLGGNLLTIGISGIDNALWDLKARSLGVPVYELLGGKFRDSVPVYTGVSPGSSPDDLAADIRSSLERGYHAMKIGLPGFYSFDPGMGASKRAPSDSQPGYMIDARRTETELLPRRFWKTVEEYFQVARETAGDDIDLMVDCHGRLNVSNAIRLCEVLEPFGLTFIEEPTSYERPDWLREVSRRSTTPIAAGERWGNHYSSAAFIESHSVAVAQPDVGLCGGLTVARKIANAAESHGISIAFHNPFGPFQSAATWQIAATLPNLLIAEGGPRPERMALWGKYTSDPPVVIDGAWTPTNTPGLGPRLRVEEIESNPPSLELDLNSTR